MSRHRGPSILNNILSATPSAAGPFWLLGLSFGRLGVSIFTFWGTILASREHPGKPFWHLRTSLGDCGSSRMDSRWSFTRFYLIFGVILGPVCINLWNSRTFKCRFFCSGLFPGHLFIDLPNRGFRMESITKSICHGNSF